MADLAVVEYRPEPSAFAWTFGGVPPVRTVKPGDVLELWTEDAFGGKVRGPDDVVSRVMELHAGTNWIDPGSVPPPPKLRVTPLDHAVRLEWDNRPEVLIHAGQAGQTGTEFVGYNVYKLADWRRRESLLPPLQNWALLASFGPDAANSQIPLGAVTDSSVDYERILFNQLLYPVGRYGMTDSLVKNGFDYVYAVSTVFNVGRLSVASGLAETASFSIAISQS